MSAIQNPEAAPLKRSIPQSACGLDMDDTPDLEPLRKSPLLLGALSAAMETLWPVFNRADSEAIHHQRYHRVLARVALSCGTVAVLTAIVQLALGGEYDAASKLTALCEVVSLLLCIAAVVFGIVTARQRRWLVQRHLAQRCRSLKFQSLTWPDLWKEDWVSWKATLTAQLAQVVAANTNEDVHAWLEYEPVVNPPLYPEATKLGNELTALKDYYRRKRLDVQIGYFTCRAKEHGHRGHLLHRLPVWCFFGSVLFATAHFSADLAHASLLHHLGYWCIVGAAALPVVGAGIRSWLLAFEFTRSASLFRAKARTLSDLRDKLGSAEGESVLQLIWQCEAFLEEEHRDWLRLVHEAEWFG